MKGFLSYLHIQFKRYIKGLPLILAVMLLIFSAIGIMAWSYMQSRMNSEEYSLASVGIVGDMEGSYLGLGITAIESLDPSRNMVNFVTMTEEEADKALSEGEIAIYIIVPDNFIDDISSGRNVKLTMVGRNSKGIGSMLMYELSEIVSVYIDSSETAIYSMQYLAEDKGVQNALGEVADDFFVLETEILFSRDDVLKISAVGVGTGSSVTGYYFCGISILFFLLMGISFSAIFVRQKKEICRVLWAKETGPVVQIISEYICFLFTTLCLITLLVGIASVIIRVTGTELPLWNTQPREARWLPAGMLLPAIFSKWIPVVIMITSLQFLIFEITSSVVSAVLTQFLTAVILGYSSGLFYPVNYFPVFFQKMTAFLPTRFALNYCQSTLLWEKNTAALLFMILYSVLFIMLSFFVRKIKLRK